MKIHQTRRFVVFHFLSKVEQRAEKNQRSQKSMETMSIVMWDYTKLILSEWAVRAFRFCVKPKKNTFENFANVFLAQSIATANSNERKRDDLFNLEINTMYCK